MRLYRGRFMIGIYALEDEGETCLAICENIKEFAKVTGMTESSARMTISYLVNGKLTHIRFANKLRTLELIDMLI